jgi:hypothetical protein
MRNRTPVITSLKRTPRRINNHLIIPKLQIPLPGQLNQPIQVPLLKLGIQPSLIERIKIMANMYKLGAIKDLLILIDLDIGANKATHPIIRDDD